MKIVFMGTPDFAAGALQALIDAGHEILAVVTQPDKAQGRSKELVPSPVKKCALEHGIEVLQPVRIKRPEEVEKLKKYTADVFVVAAFGQILSQEILDMPRLGCLNIHASLLPKYRGASPIQHVIIDGEEESGVTIMQMDAGLDTGDMLYKKAIPILDTDNFETLHDKLMELGAKAIVEALPLLEKGELQPVKQVDEESCYAPLITKEMGRLDFAKDADVIDRLIRGLTPWPSAYTFYHGKQLKIWEAVNQVWEEKDQFKPGDICLVEKDAIWIRCKSGALKVTCVQLEGKKRMSVHDFLLGVKMQVGERMEAKA